MKLLKYETFEEQQKVELYFEGNQTATLYKFGKDYISNCSDWVTKEALAQIKQKLIKDGINTDLNCFINQEFKRYWEE